MRLCVFLSIKETGRPWSPCLLRWAALEYRNLAPSLTPSAAENDDLVQFFPPVFVYLPARLPVYSPFDSFEVFLFGLIFPFLF